MLMSARVKHDLAATRIGEFVEAADAERLARLAQEALQVSRRVSSGHDRDHTRLRHRAVAQRLVRLAVRLAR